MSKEIAKMAQHRRPLLGVDDLGRRLTYMFVGFAALATVLAITVPLLGKEPARSTSYSQHGRCPRQNPRHPHCSTAETTASTSPGLSASMSRTSSPKAARPAVASGPPSRDGYFGLRPVGGWSALPDGDLCASRVRHSTWEPRPANAVHNHTMPDPSAVRRSLSARPRAVGGTYDTRWDTWLLARVDGQFTGTTDEIFQWAACKWGLPDNLLRAIAVRESTWYQYLVYPSGRPVVDYGSGDMMVAHTTGAGTFCDAIARYGRDYQRDFGTDICPRTFSIAGVMSWQAPSWGTMRGNQNGTFPFNRDSTAFAVDYMASQLRGCYEGWELWLADVSGYAAGDLWGCVGNWYAGEWHSDSAKEYASRVRQELTNRTWLKPDWPSDKPPCHPTYGCPRSDRR
jgi:hypothetical protein